MLFLGLGYPQERDHRLPTVATGDTFPHGPQPTPVLIYTSGSEMEKSGGEGGVCGVWPPPYVAAWSHFYAKFPRKPHVTNIVPPYVANRHTKLPGGEVGWGEHVTQAPWNLGPLSAGGGGDRMDDPW